MRGLQGTRALVTGGARGIGRAVCERLASEGVKVAVSDVLQDQGEKTVSSIKDSGGDAVYIKADMSDPADIERLVKEAVETLGGLDILVNNAGVSTAGFIESVTDQEIDRVVGVNLIGVMRLTRAAAPALKKSGRGRIINLSSVEGIRGSGLVPVYSATKAGVLGLTRSNAIELSRYKITVNAVCPGPIDTEMMAPLMADEKFRLKIQKGVPLKRMGEPSEVAAAVAFFASEDASYITGNHLVIDGGMTVKAL